MKRISSNPLMRRDLIGLLGIGMLLAIGSCAAGPPDSAMPGEGHEQGAILYADHCAACHGDTGRGDGAMSAFLPIAPRDFRNDKFRFISASFGEMATDDDITRFIRTGSRASIMPGHPQLSGAEVNQLTSFVRELRKFGVMLEVEDSFLEDDEEYTDEDLEEIAADRLDAAPALEIPGRPADYQGNTARGAELFASNCASCHGPRGRGDGSEELADDHGFVILARDLTRGEYRGGGLDRDLFWRIRCGIPGTPMPALESSIVSDPDVWQLVDYLRFLALPK